jgi:hypothetical protein
MKLEVRSLVELLSDLARNWDNGWSIGSFGAIGEFVRGELEPATLEERDLAFQVTTARGGIRIAPTAPMRAIAYDTLSPDGEGWSHALALCAMRSEEPQGKIVALGPDLAALRAPDRNAQLFDLGVATGCVRMCIRVQEASLASALNANAGRDLLSRPELVRQIISVQPHRVMLSAAGRIEVYQPIPTVDEKSPPGPHTHLLPKLIATKRTHSSNVPVPEGWQPVLTVHPKSPWRDADNMRVPYNETADAAFQPLLERFGLPEDKEVRESVKQAVKSGKDAAAFEWPATRRGRTTARITLRRLSAARMPSVAGWRALRDNAPIDSDGDPDA